MSTLAWHTACVLERQHSVDTRKQGVIMKRHILLFGIITVFSGISSAAPPEPSQTAGFPVPEWKRQGPLVMVWPEFISRGRGMVPAAQEIISSLPDKIEIGLTSPRPPDPARLQQIGRGVRYLPSASVSSVFIQDWGGHPAVFSDGRLYIAKFHYDSRQFSGRTAALAQHNNEAGRQIADLLYGHFEDVPLIASGTHIHLNGAGVALVSHRVIAENEHLSLSEITSLLHEHLRIEQVVFIPVPPGESNGRIDGLVRFASEQTVLLAQPSATNAHARSFSDKVKGLLNDSLEDSFQVIPVPVEIKDWGSVAGNYLHFIQTENYVLMPLYGSPADNDTLNQFSGLFPDIRIYPINAAPLNEFEHEGISLNRLLLSY